MNPRQRRGLLLILLAGLLALVVFLATTRYVSSVNSQVAPKVTVYQTTKDLSAYSVLSSEDLQAVEVPKKWLPASAAQDLSAVEGRRVAYNVAQGTYLGMDMLLPPSSLDASEREVALTVDAKTGIAGRVQSGDRVDVLAVFADQENPADNTSMLVARNVRVVSVGGVETRSEQTSRTELAERDVIAVTLALDQRQTYNVTLADTTAATVRLIGLPAGIEDLDRRREPNGTTVKDLLAAKGR